jgi:hypothetical protein
MIEAEGTALPQPGTKAQCGADTDARIVDLLVRADDALGANCWVPRLLLVLVRALQLHYAFHLNVSAFTAWGLCEHSPRGFWGNQSSDVAHDERWCNILASIIGASAQE